MMDTAMMVCMSASGIARRALDLLVDGLRMGLTQRGEAHLALTGGSSASALFGLLREDPRARRVDWSAVHVWQGDERFVPMDHPDRNWTTALREWLAAEDRAAIPTDHLHPMPIDEAIAAGEDNTGAARRYAQLIERTLPSRRGIPAFDVILLGVGGDAHILSTFPGTAPINEHRVPVLAVPSPTHIEPHLPRVTLAPFLLEAAGAIVVMVPGDGKASAIRQCFTSPIDPSRLPAQLAIRPNAVWLLEPGSAAQTA
jgi:6-phosphogluconolactonase